MWKLGGHLIMGMIHVSDWVTENLWQAITCVILGATIQFVAVLVGA